ncbi:UNVERIFIED_CONTAM: hypothetical protein HDU68_000453 [Siphonaria sp. JEL0065]|nr:hypothetical protein HDU68_000453 [Siphonaria sp. JEL0065]
MESGNSNEGESVDNSDHYEDSVLKNTPFSGAGSVLDGTKNAFVIKEIAAMRLEYLKNGGTNPLILDQINQLEARVIIKSNVNSNNLGNTTKTSKHEFDSPTTSAATAAEPEIQLNPKLASFEEIDMINIPPYDEFRGFTVFVDLVTGVPYFGGGSSAKIELFYTVFNGATAACPVDTIVATCHRQPVSFLGKALFQESQRFYDAHHKRIDVSKLDIRNTSTGAEYRIFKPSYNNFEYYDAIQLSYLSEMRSMSTVLDTGDLNAGGKLGGSRLLGSTNTLNMNQVLHCSLGLRIDQLKNLDIEADVDVRVRIKIGSQQDAYVSGIAEMGFQKNTYGWPDDIAVVVCNDLPIVVGTRATVELVGSVGGGQEQLLTLEPIVIELFQQVNDSIVINEGQFALNANIINTQIPCEIAIRLYSDARIPAPFNFDSKRLDKPMPSGAWFKVGRDPNIQCTLVSDEGGLGFFKFSIDGGSV